jgi:hypothetical protein
MGLNKGLCNAHLENQIIKRPRYLRTYKAYFLTAQISSPVNLLKCKGKKGNAIPVTGREGPWGCEMLMLPHFLDNRLTDSSEVVSLKRRPHFTPQEDPWYLFLLDAESIPGP